MNSKLLFQTELDISTEFHTEKERNIYQKEITAKFQQALENAFVSYFLSKNGKKAVLRYFKIFAKISSEFYAPITVRYYLNDNVIWFGVKLDYLLFSKSSVPDWTYLMQKSGLEIIATDDKCFRAEAALTNVFLSRR